MRAMFGPSTEFQLPKAKSGEQVDILSFVVTRAGWESLQHRLKLSPSNHVRILTRLIHKAAIDPIKQAGAKWHYLENNHAKVILYRKQKVAVLGSFNLTKHSLERNIECFSSVDPADYEQLEQEFERLWGETEEKPIAIIRTRDDLAQAMATALDDGEEEELGEDAPPCEAERTEGPRPPWDFQEPIIQSIMDWLDTPQDFELGRIVKLPTGAGKTLVAAEVIRRLLEKKPQARILLVCHRVELLRQSVKSIRRQINGAIPEKAWFVPQHVEDESGVRDRKEFGRSKECQVVFCTQGMLPHLLKYNRQNHFDVTVVDECHRFHRRSTLYWELFKYCRNRNIPRLGLTATPLHPDKRGFGKCWAETMYGKDISEDDLEREGFLSRRHPTLTKRWPTTFTFACKKEHAGPEHIESELVTRVKEFDNPIVNCEVEKAWQEYRDKRQRVLCFAVTIDHAETLKSKYFANDVRVRVAHSKLPTEEIRNNLEWFQDPDASETRMLVSVMMLAEGIDLPKTDCLFMVRPTFSKELHQQMIGRGMRGPHADGTEDCAIVDFTSQFVARNGQALEQVTTELDGDVTSENNGTVSEEDEEPDDSDASGRIWTVRDLKEEVADLQGEKELTVENACKELARELDYSYRTLVNYLYTKPDDYPLGWEDPETDPAEQLDDSSDAVSRGSEANEPRAITHNTLTNGPTGSEGNVTRNKLLDLRACNPQRFEEIASLTNVESSTLRSYCSDQENFRRWKTNNKDKMDQVRVVLAESLARASDAA